MVYLDGCGGATQPVNDMIQSVFQGRTVGSRMAIGFICCVSSDVTDWNRKIIGMQVDAEAEGTKKRMMIQMQIVIEIYLNWQHCHLRINK